MDFLVLVKKSFFTQKMANNVFAVLCLMLVTLYGHDGRFVIRKCCPADQHFDDDLDCVPNIIPTQDLVAFNQSYGLGGTWPWWFPKYSSLREFQNKNSFLSGLPEDSVVMAGVSEPCCEAESAILLSTHFDFDFFDDGSILIYKNSQQGKDLTYPPNSFCVDRAHGVVFEVIEEYIIKLCPCKIASCIYKCCQYEMLLAAIPSKVENSNECKREPKDVSSSLMPLESATLCVQEANSSNFSSNSTNVSEWQPDGIDNFFILYGFPQCGIDDDSVLTELHSDQKHEFLEDGKLYLGTLGTAEKLKYCADFGGYSQLEKSTFVLRCYPRFERLLYENLKRILYGSLAAIGAFFLMLTLCTYSLLAREMTVNDRNLIAQTWSLLIGYISIAIFHFFRYNMHHNLCVFFGYVIFYAFLASFFWLNVLCIDLAWAFSELRLIRNMKVWQNRRRFLQYSVYAWLSPAVIVLVAIIIDFSPHIPDYILKPEFVTKCFFANDSLAKLAYFYGPMAVLLAANLVLFLFTAYKIRSAQRQASTLVRNSHTQEKQRVILYLKLFSLMGLSWVFELISWAVGGPDYYWYGTDIINLFRAVFIFITLCCKKQVLEELREKFKITVPRGRQAASNSVVTLASNLATEPTHNQLSNNIASSSL